MFDFILRPLRRNFGPDKAYYRMIHRIFGFTPHNIELYKLALIHRSASLVLEDGHTINNERLEFLGDAVIEAVTSDYLFIEFPDEDEGFLTQMRSRLVSRQSLNALAVEIGLDQQIIASSSAGLQQKHIFGDAFEAMMGAIYLDQGYNFVNRLLINNIFYRHMNLDEVTSSDPDYKSRLIEWCQKHRHRILFRTNRSAGGSQAHPTFDATVEIDGMAVGYGAGESKKEAEQQAAWSVAHAMNDEQAASLLDYYDRVTAPGKGGVSTAEASQPAAASAPKSSAKPAKTPKAPKAAKPEQAPQPEKREKSEKGAKSDAAEQAGQTVKVEQTKVEQTEKVEKAEKPTKAKTSKAPKAPKAPKTPQEQEPKAPKTPKAPRKPRAAKSAPKAEAPAEPTAATPAESAAESASGPTTAAATIAEPRPAAEAEPQQPQAQAQ